MKDLLIGVYERVFMLDFLIDFINTAIGAFLGFLFALYIERKNKKNNRLESIENIKDELRDFRMMLETIGNDSIPNKDSTDFPSPFAYSIYMPIWEAVQSSGDLLQFRNKEYYNELIHIYELILKWKNIEDWMFENYKTLDKNEKKDIQNNLVSLRNQIYIMLSSDNGTNSSIYNLLLKTE